MKKTMKILMQDIVSSQRFERDTSRIQVSSVTTWENLTGKLISWPRIQNFQLVSSHFANGIIHVLKTVPYIYSFYIDLRNGAIRIHFGTLFAETHTAQERKGISKEWIGNYNKKILKEVIVYLPLIRHGGHRKRKNRGIHRHREQSDFLSLLTKVKWSTQWNMQQGGIISLILFFLNKESRLHRHVEMLLMKSNYQ